MTDKTDWTLTQVEILLGLKLFLDLVMGVAISYFMWHLKFKELLKEVLDS